MPVIPTLERLRQENFLESHANLGYIVIQTLPFNKRKRGEGGPSPDMGDGVEYLFSIC